MTASVRNVAAGQGFAAATATWSVTKPTVQVGDYWVVGVFGSSTSVTVAAPTGWTALGTVQTSPGNDTRAYLFRRKVDGSEGATQDFTWAGGGNGGVAVSFSVRDGHASSPIDGVAGGTFASSTTPSGPSLTPSVDNCLVLAFFGCDQAASGVTWTAPTGYAEEFDFQDASVFESVGVFSKQQTTATAETPQATTSTADEGVSFTVAFAPAAVVAATQPAQVVVG